MCTLDNSNLVDFIFPGVSSDPPPPPNYFLDQMILGPRNTDVSAMNDRILEQLLGDETVFYSGDSVIVEDGVDAHDARNNDIPAEFLQAVAAPGMPPGKLYLKLGCPVILLRNLNPAQGLCNGTRINVTCMANRVLEACLIGGKHDGKIVLILRISVILSDLLRHLNFSFKRQQFPVQLAFALTINKAQEQLVQYVGLDLRNPVFAHGQLYVALSHVTNSANVWILLPTRADSGDQVAGTTNAVYKDVLL